MNDVTRPATPAMVPGEAIFDRTPMFVPDGTAAGLPDPVVYDASTRALRTRTINFAAKRFADMVYVSGLDHATAEDHFRWRAAMVPGGLSGREQDATATAQLAIAHKTGRIRIETSDTDRRATVRWSDADFGPPIVGSAIARAGYGGILLGGHVAPAFDPKSIARRGGDTATPWPFGDAVDTPKKAPAEVSAALDALFRGSRGLYGILIATPDRILLERYSDFSGSDRVTPSWSMTKAITCTVIGRLIHDRWLNSVHAPAPAPLWRDPRAAQHAVTIDHLLRMRSGLGFPVMDEHGRVTLGFENSAVYHDAGNAFEAAQRSIVATVPGSVFRYVNSGVNVLGAIIRDQIEHRGLPYHQTAYQLVVDRLGMSSYQHSADLVGNLIASGAGFATLRDYAKLGVLYVNNGVWNNERILPESWADYALTATHTGTSYAACFRSNVDGQFPDLPPDTAWASGASDQRIFILRRSRMVVAVANESDYPMDLGALNRAIATAVAAEWR